MSNSKQFIIHRGNWFRGHGPNFSRLLVTERSAIHGPPIPKEFLGQMCCLGNYALACQVDPRRIANVAYPSNIRNDTPTEMKWLVRVVGKAEREALDAAFEALEVSPSAMRDFSQHRTWQRFMAGINDSVQLTPKQREGLLTKAFELNGVEVAFE